MDDPEILGTMLLAVRQLNWLILAYLRLGEADWDDALPILPAFRQRWQAFRNLIIVTGNKMPAEGERRLAGALVKLGSFGRKLIANPDYPARVLPHLHHRLPHPVRRHG